MRKFLINIILTLIIIIIPYNAYAISTSSAKEKIDTSKGCNLILNYYYDDYAINDINVDIYYIASIREDYIYELSSLFKDYPIEINGIKTIKDWSFLEQTINSYIEADNIETNISNFIYNNKVEFLNLNPGLYFIKTDKIDNENALLMFDTFLITIPNLDESGSWNYDVVASPKVEEYIPKYEKVSFTVVKEWVDNEINRPDSIDIEIYKDSELVEHQVLSKTNNWTYEWQSYDDGSIWTVVERNIPEGYKVSIKNNKNNFIIVNKNVDYKEENPSTFDNIKIYYYLVFGSFIGLLMLVINFGIQKKK